MRSTKWWQNRGQITHKPLLISYEQSSFFNKWRLKHFFMIEIILSENKWSDYVLVAKRDKLYRTA